MTMGTASTMSTMAESLGLALPFNSAIPAVDSRRSVLAHMSGRRIVEMVRENLTMSKILTREAFENAIRVNGAVSGSTNAVIHLLAIAGRIGVRVTLEDWDRIGHDTPTLVDLKPSGRYLMEDYYYAGGLPAVIRHLGDQNLLHRDAMTVNGQSIWENCKDAPNWNKEVVRSIDNPVTSKGGIAVLRGNLAPDGAVIKRSAASAHLLLHVGPAVVFDGVDDLNARIDDPSLEITADSVLVLRGAGPRGGPGMPEVGHLPIPRRLLDAGVTDMVRVSDARMSGTSTGTVVLHVAPEAAIGGPLASVRDGDRIRLDVEAGNLDLLVDPTLLAEREPVVVAATKPLRGYDLLYWQHVGQAPDGCDFDFLQSVEKDTDRDE